MSFDDLRPAERQGASGGRVPVVKSDVPSLAGHRLRVASQIAPPHADNWLRSVRADDMFYLQRTYGNHMVQQIVSRTIQRQPSPAPVANLDASLVQIEQ